MLSHKGRNCLLVKEFVLKAEGQSIPYILAQLGKAFHYLVYPKEEYVVADSVNESDSSITRRDRRKRTPNQEKEMNDDSNMR